MKRLGECDAVQKRKLQTRNHVFVRVYMSNRTKVVTCAPFLKNENGNPSVRKWKQHIPSIYGFLPGNHFQKIVSVSMKRNACA